MKIYSLLFSVLLSSITFAQTWQDVGGGNSNSTHGLLTWNGNLVNLGSFNNTPCDRVALWDGTSWSCLAGGVGIVARAGVVWDGKLVVVGDFWNNFQPCVGCNGVAVWDGVSWSPLGTGVNNDVLTCTVWNNELVIAGDFTQADGVPCGRIVKWNGVTWETVGPIGSFDNDVRCMVEYDGDLWVGGDFNNVGGQGPLDGVVKYDETTANWVGGNSGVDLIGGVNETVRVLYVNPNDGNLYMGGEFPELWDGDAVAEDYDMGGIAMYDGSNWYPLGTGLNEYCRAIHEYNGDIIAGGYFTTAGGVACNKIAKWNGTTWSPMGLGFDGAGVDEYVKAATTWNGIFFAGGAYTQCEGNPMSYIAQWYEAPTAAPVAWMTPSTTQLCGSGCVDFVDNSTNNPTIWNWSFPGSNTPTSTVQDPLNVCYSSPGTYTASLQACNGIGCTTQNIDIEVSAGATVSVNNASICGGGPELITATPSVSGGTFLWSPTMETTASISVNPGTTTDYTVTYSYLGCSSQAISTVSVGTGPSVLVSGTNSICEGESTTLTATPDVGGGTYLWSPGGQTTESITVSPTTTTNYTCEYTLNGCSSTPVIQSVTVTATPTVSVSDESICGGGSATLVASPSVSGGSYLWSPGSETTQSITLSPGTTTSYSVIYTLNGCPSSSESGTINVGTTPSLTVADQTICDGESSTLTATPDIGGGTYLWNTTETTQSIVASPSTSTTYDVIYTVNGCPSNSEIINLTVNPMPSVNANSETICEGDMASLTATPSLPGGTYLWSPGNETTPTINVSPNSTTSYSVVYTLNGCSSQANSGVVTVNPTPIVLIDDISICDNDPSGTLVATPDFAGGTYLWSPGGETTATITVPATATTYSVVYTLNGCPSSMETGTVTLSTSPSVNVSDLSICEGEDGIISATPSTSGGTYLWSPGGETTQDITVPSTATSYSVIYTLNGCSSNSEVSTVTTLALPNVGVTEFNNEITADLAGATYQWVNCDNGNAPIAGETNQTFSPTSNGNYAVEVTINGCKDLSECTIISTIGVNELTTQTISIHPNPTSDLIEIVGLSDDSVEFEILDALGRIVLSGELNENRLIDLSELAPGNYYVKMNKTYLIRVIKE